MSKFVSHRSPLARATGTAVLMLACVAPLGCGSDEPAAAPATSPATAPVPASPRAELSAQDLAKKRFDDTSPAPASKNR